MSTYSYAQLEGLWIQAGGSTATAPVAAAIAEAESSGNSAATSSNPDGGTNVGLWQLDTPGGGGAGYTVDQLLDPATNAVAAVRASSAGSDWNTWATYVSGAYKAFLSAGTTPDGNVPGGGTSGAGATLTSSTAVCLISYPSAGALGVSVGGGCILSRSEARGLIGGALMAAAGLMGLAAVIIIAASAFEHSGAQGAVTRAAGAVGAAAWAAG